jgi:two-component system chemotaxis response regulator CheB
MNKIKVLIVDDSSLVRTILSQELSKIPELEVVATAKDAYVASEKIVELNPDVITLDVEMPRMDGITFLEKLMQSRPMPVIIFSSVTPKGCEAAIRALELGAIDVIQKPEMGIPYKLQEMILVLAEKIKVAGRVKERVAPSVRQRSMVTESYTAMTHTVKVVDRVVAIGASTGGTDAIRQILGVLPANFPGIIITQHMPAGFTASFAKRLNEISAMTVSEAKQHDVLQPGVVLLAPGNHHMILKYDGRKYFVEINQEPHVNHQRPSVEVMFESVVKCTPAKSIGVILTGMGGDGADGLLKLRQAGAFTIGQDDQSCVVYGMPKVAYEKGAVMKQLPLAEIPKELMRLVSGE